MEGFGAFIVWPQLLALLAIGAVFFLGAVPAAEVAVLGTAGARYVF